MSKYRFNLEHMPWERECALAQKCYTTGTKMADQRTGYGEPCDPRLDTLKERLLDACGFAVCLPAIEEDLTPMLERGQFLRGLRSRMMRGEPCQCHMNSAHLYDQNRDTARIWTGYAMSRDGVWRQHSWVVSEGRIYETTTRRLLYYGYELTIAEAEKFVEDNWI